MRLTRVYVPGPLEAGGACALRGEPAHHVVRVLRLGVGARVDVFDGQGAEYVGRIEAVRKGEVMLMLGARRDGSAESPLRLTLAQGVSRGERMDWVVQKATELGVSRVVPVLSERSVVRLDPRQALSKQRHWQRIAVSACEQSGRDRIPEVALPLPMAGFLHGLPQVGARLLLSPAGSVALAGLDSVSAAIVLIGPEGGLTEGEQRAALAQGFVALSLGPRVLRTETAAVAALALLQHRFGDL